MHKDNFDHFVGEMVSDDPFDAPDFGRVCIERRPYVPNDPPGFYEIADMSHYEGMLLSIHFFTSQWSTIEGSAIMIAPGIALTALHVLNDYKDLITSGQLSLLCMGLTKSGGRLWRVVEVLEIKESDIAILKLKFASPAPVDRWFIQARLTARLPKLGELVMVAGFQFSDDYIPADKDKAFAVKDGKLNFGARLRVSVGVVREHHLAGRNPMSGPVIEADCACPGGMSGGPMFDKDGRVVGVLSRSLIDVDGSGYSLIPLLWGALVREIKPSFLTHLFPETFRLLDLDKSLCEIDERDAMSLVADPTSGEIRPAWSGPMT
jgi:S1-C subfamily serine protease